jgi:hypothetical protein
MRRRRVCRPFWSCPTALFVTGILLWPALAAALPPDSEERVSPAQVFSLSWARRRQQREATPGAPFRSDIPWPARVPGDERRWWANLSAGGEWDTQPVLFPNGIGDVYEIHDDSHEAAGAWFVDGGGEVFRSGNFAAGIATTYWGSAHSGVDFDTHYPTLASWFDWHFAERFSLRLNYNFGYAWVDNDAFATTHFVGPSFFADWDGWGETMLRGDYYDYDFKQIPPDYRTGDEPQEGGYCVVPPPDPPPPFSCAPEQFSHGARRWRSGWGFIFAGEHRVELDWNKSEIRGGYTYEHFIPDGAEYHNQAHEFWLGGTTALPFGFLLDGNVTFIYQSARNETSVPPQPRDLVPNRVYSLRGYRRKDRIWRVYTAIGRSITRNISASVEYGFENHHSNLEPYHYDRHRIGGYLTIHFGRGGA